MELRLTSRREICIGCHAFRILSSPHDDITYLISRCKTLGAWGKRTRLIMPVWGSYLCTQPRFGTCAALTRSNKFLMDGNSEVLCFGRAVPEVSSCIVKPELVPNGLRRGLGS